MIEGADSAMQAHGLSGFDPPAAWLTPVYVRNARMHGDVGRHWERPPNRSGQCTGVADLRQTAATFDPHG